MDTSPNAQKVTDFLSSYSQLHQDRISQDNQLSRDLGRDIELLKGTNQNVLYLLSGTPIHYSSFQDQAPLIQFNREKFSQSPPPMPQRPTDEPAPMLPTRKYLHEDNGPDLPRRKYMDDETTPALPKRKVSGPPLKPKPVISEFTIDLVNPVAKNDTKDTLNRAQDFNDITEKYGLRTKFQPATSSNQGKKYRSFMDVEHSIKQENNSKFSQTNNKPIKPVKSNWLNSSIKASKPTDNNATAKSPLIGSTPSPTKSETFPKSETTVAISPVREKNPTSWLDSVVNKSPKRFDSKIVIDKPVIKPKPKENVTQHGATNIIPKPSDTSQTTVAKPIKPINKPLKTPLDKLVDKLGVKPVLRPKPDLKNFKDKDNELLLSQLTKLKSTKTPVPPKYADFKTNDNQALKDKLVNLSPTRTGNSNGTNKGEFARSGIGKYKDVDNALLNEQLNKIKSKPEVKPKPEVKAIPEPKPKPEVKAIPEPKPKPEVKAKPEVKSKPEPKPKPEVTSKPEKPKPEAKPKPAIEIGSSKPPSSSAPIMTQPNGSQTSLSSLDFKSHLATMLRSNTDPASTKPPKLERSLTDPAPTTTTKLTYPNKSRSKGPKRRLPKNLTVAPTAGSGTKVAEVPELVKPVPPPIKPKPQAKLVGDVLTTLQFKGEVFI